MPALDQLQSQVVLAIFCTLETWHNVSPITGNQVQKSMEDEMETRAVQWLEVQILQDVATLNPGNFDVSHTPLYNSSFHFLALYPHIIQCTIVVACSCHFLFYYRYITPIY